MKIPFPFACPACGTRVLAESELHEGTVERSCACGHRDKVLLGLDFTPGPTLLMKSRYELSDHKDWNAAIVFAATAVECELSFNHMKWRKIDDMTSMIDAAVLRDVISDRELEEELRTYRGINEKIEGVCTLMDQRGIDGFVASDSRIRSTIENGFPSLKIGTLAECIREHLFWPRNRILHLGDTRKTTAEDATRCVNIAALILWILDEMDKNRRKSVP